MKIQFEKSSQPMHSMGTNLDDEFPDPIALAHLGIAFNSREAKTVIATDRNHLLIHQSLGYSPDKIPQPTDKQVAEHLWIAMQEQLSYRQPQSPFEILAAKEEEAQRLYSSL